ncbi:hypothetical protein NEUTE1DRAFT_62701 [Neurospora tetrasperma FGSC 2508]|uniref:Uncharacterized protein n=1 Tax=Neurospora tetrasperma (strain FGSC 2508 / ATCC MYA-4615 / P0657) TaxID=510951 RepID=F8MLS2_NEUT8|nr:uncharacterized protein NEUTE1DRAFT_62701 [Neurospora tetrasperma FGSC 2508]EGO57641.1 hypothetical protein NEUTE1DRAFT_62701 [Neurospora tetrasperma FGSC 2508]EGZ72090.1 hypothetical protein NEUTE2DRAFT_111373 [Neurospora tetrasperma FGSC 2509]
MHNDQDFVQQEYLETSHQPDMGSYMTNQGDMFNYQLSGTTTGDFANPQPFWETDPSLEVMEIDFNGASSSLFRQEPHPPSRPMNSLNWETSTPNHFIPENVLVNGGRVVSSGGNEHVMVSQAPMQALMTSSADQIMYTGTYATAIDNFFGIINTGVDPGLLFSRPSSATMDASFDAVAQGSSRGPSRQISQGAQSGNQETAGPRTRTQAKFTIDENGRARVETTLVVERDNPMAVRKRTSSQSVGGCRRWCSEDDEESSADDEPIIIPSRNTSFSIPDPRKSRTAVNTSSHSQPNFSFSAQSTTSLGSFRSDGGLHDLGDESDDEILFSEMTPTSKMSGDAVNELLKLREDRMRQKSSPSKMRRLTSSSHSNSTGTSVSMNFASRFTASPTALTEASLPTPSSSDATASVTKMRARIVRDVATR